MTQTPLLILAGDTGWLPLFPAPGAGPDRGLPVDGADNTVTGGADFLPDAAAVIEAIRCHHGDGARRHAHPGVVIGLASHRCFAARVGATGLPARQSRQALAFRYESAVPFAVEELVLDAAGAGEDRLVVATRSEPLRAFVHGLEDAGVRVGGVAPLALLAVQAADGDTVRTADGSADLTYRFAEPPALCAAHVPSFSEATCSNSGELRAWRWRPATAADGSASIASSSPVTETLRLAQATTRRVINDDQPLWINLLRGPLASRHKLDRVRRPLTAMLAAATLLLVASVGAMQARTWQHRAAADAYDAQTRSMYTSAFPGEAVPVSMERRLTTRRRELRGRQGLANTEGPLFADDNTLAILHDLLQRLPADTRLILTDLRLTGDRIDLVGQARSHSDADTLAAALRDDGRFEVTPPSTENLPTRGVQFSLHLVPREPPANTDGTTGDALASEQPSASARRDDTPTASDRAQGGTP